jgi:hypothetical protein
MKVINKSIEMIAMHNKDGEPKPIRFRITDENSEEYVYPVKQVLTKVKEKCEGNLVWRFNCYVMMDGNIQRLVEIRYHIMETRWYLYKM